MDNNTDNSPDDNNLSNDNSTANFKNKLNAKFINLKKGISSLFSSYLNDSKRKKNLLSRFFHNSTNNLDKNKTSNVENNIETPLKKISFMNANILLSNNADKNSNNVNDNEEIDDNEETNHKYETTNRLKTHYAKFLGSFVNDLIDHKREYPNYLNSSNKYQQKVEKRKKTRANKLSFLANSISLSVRTNLNKGKFEVLNRLEEVANHDDSDSFLDNQKEESEEKSDNSLSEIKAKNQNEYINKLALNVKSKNLANKQNYYDISNLLSLKVGLKNDNFYYYSTEVNDKPKKNPNSDNKDDPDKQEKKVQKKINFGGSKYFENNKSINLQNIKNMEKLNKIKHNKMLNKNLNIFSMEGMEKRNAINLDMYVKKGKIER